MAAKTRAMVIAIMIVIVFLFVYAGPKFVRISYQFSIV